MKRKTKRATGMPLVVWREPERNAHVLDWRERAHAFGLIEAASITRERVRQIEARAFAKMRAARHDAA